MSTTWFVGWLETTRALSIPSLRRRCRTTSSRRCTRSTTVTDVSAAAHRSSVVRAWHPQRADLTVSPWFEARRLEYYDRLLAVSCVGEWDQWVSFFAQGLEESAQTTRGQMLQLVEVQSTLKEPIRASSLRADSAHALVDYAVANPSFTVRQVERDLALSYGRANGLVAQLVDLGVMADR